MNTRKKGGLSRLAHRVHSLSLAARVALLLFRAAPSSTLLLFFLLFVEGLLPTGVVLVNKSIIDSVVAGRAEGLAISAGIWLVLSFLGSLISPLTLLLQGNLSEKFTAFINQKIFTKLIELKGISIYESASFHDKVKVLRDGAKSRPVNFIVNMVYIARSAVSAASILIILFGFSVWYPVVLFVSAVPYVWATLRMREVGWRALLGRSREARELEYLASLPLVPRAAPEVLVYGLHGWLYQQYRSRFRHLHAYMAGIRLRETIRLLPALSVSVGGVALVFLSSIREAARGQRTPGEIALLLQSFSQIHSSLLSASESLSYLMERLLFFDYFFEFLQIKSSLALPRTAPLGGDRGATLGSLRLSEPDLVFEGVGFSYPNGNTALLDINFRIPYGRKVAIVGENGAGKSTLIKLLMRLYDPTAGRILVQGVDLRDLEPESWRKTIGVVFQDFMRYNFTLRENVALSDVSALADERKFKRAVERARLGAIIDSLPDGANTLLGREFGGSELSSGQWQRIALGRAIFREAQILVFDEPSAALDPKIEAELFSDFTALGHGKTVFLVSHRLASVRHADLILVLKGGRIVERGTHEQLVTEGSNYAKLWAAQASRYKG